MSGDPGELHGIFVSGKRGSVIANTENGIFGVYSSLPDALAKKERIAVGKRSEIHDGDAVIYCTLGNTTEEYSVSISNIGSKDSSSKNFTVTVTDEKLLELTGGIVQGMSRQPDHPGRKAHRSCHPRFHQRSDKRIWNFYGEYAGALTTSKNTLRRVSPCYRRQSPRSRKQRTFARYSRKLDNTVVVAKFVTTTVCRSKFSVLVPPR